MVIENIKLVSQDAVVLPFFFLSLPISSGSFYRNNVDERYDLSARVKEAKT